MSNNNLIKHNIPLGMSPEQFFEMKYLQLTAENMNLKAHISVLEENLCELKLELISPVVKSNEEVEKAAAKKAKPKEKKTVSWAEATTTKVAAAGFNEVIAVTLGLPKDSSEDEIMARFRTFTRWVSEIIKPEGGNVYTVLEQAVKQKYIFTNLAGFNVKVFQSMIGKSFKETLSGFNAETYAHIEHVDLRSAHSAISHKLAQTIAGGNKYDKMPKQEQVLLVSRIRDWLDLIKENESGLIWAFIASFNTAEAMKKRMNKY